MGIGMVVVIVVGVTDLETRALTKTSLVVVSEEMTSMGRGVQMPRTRKVGGDSMRRSSRTSRGTKRNRSSLSKINLQSDPSSGEGRGTSNTACSARKSKSPREGTKVLASNENVRDRRRNCAKTNSGTASRTARRKTRASRSRAPSTYDPSGLSSSSTPCRSSTSSQSRGRSRRKRCTSADGSCRSTSVSTASRPKSPSTCTPRRARRCSRAPTQTRYSHASLRKRRDSCTRPTPCLRRSCARHDPATAGTSSCTTAATTSSSIAEMAWGMRGSPSTRRRRSPYRTTVIT
mmetsp:Transcript_9076/g.24382  ORF Transcript_9076/g.24382 Transcript_9076/m.24382 type:complete len:290 (-) Transcript_9076:758-1627(-)